MNMSSDQKTTSLTTAAIYIGVPVLIGASCYYIYYVRKNQGSNSSINVNGKNKTKQMTPKEHLARLKLIGNQNFSQNNYDSAIDHYTKAIEFSRALDQKDAIKPAEFAVFYQNRAACNFELGNFEKAVSDCDKAIELRGDYVKAYVKRAKAYEKLENFDKAMVDAFSANLLEKYQSQNNMSLAENIVKTSSKIKAAKAIKNHKPTWPGASKVKNYFAAFVRDPIKEKLGGANPSIESLQALLDEAYKPENEDDPYSILVRGTCASLMSDMKTADEAIDRLVAMDGDKVTPRLKANALIKKASLVMSQPSSESSTIEKDIEQSIELYNKAIKLDPENPDLYLHKSQAFMLLEKFDEAMANLDKAIELEKDHYAAIAQKFYVEFKMLTRFADMDRVKELIRKIEDAVALYPDSVSIHEILAQVLTETMHFEEADRVLQDISRLDPENGHTYVSRALLQFHMKNDPDEVASLLEEAIKLDPNILFAYELLGSIKTQRGETNEAVKIFETALKHAQTESELANCYGLLDSAINQRVAAERLGMQA